MSFEISRLSDKVLLLWNCFLSGLSRFHGISKTASTIFLNHLGISPEAISVKIHMLSDLFLFCKQVESKKTLTGVEEEGRFLGVGGQKGELESQGQILSPHTLPRASPAGLQQGNKGCEHPLPHHRERLRWV